MIKYFTVTPAKAGVLSILFLRCAVSAVPVPSEWQFSQDVQVAQQGFIKVQLPLETLSNAQPSRADLRLMDPSGQEVSILMDQPVIESARQTQLANMTIVMANGKTVMTGQVPAAWASDGYDLVYLHTATQDFLKPVTLEGSKDKTHWVTLVNSYPVFRQPDGATSTPVEFARTHWPYLRITLDDKATPPIRIQGVSLYSAPKKVGNLSTLTVQVLETFHDTRQTELRLLLPANNLTVDSIRLQTPEGTFRRRVTAGMKQFSSGELQGIILGEGYIYRVALDAKAAEGLDIALGHRLPGRQLTLRIENGDSRPLSITQVTCQVVPTYLVFHAPAPGVYSLWSGNPVATPKNYDVASLRESLATAAFLSAELGPLNMNPSYAAPATLPQVSDHGTDIDLSLWHFRKKVTLSQAGIQRVEPDLEVLSHNRQRLSALRIVQEGKQLPYVLDYGGLIRDLEVTIESVPSKGSVSQWTLTLPDANLPLNGLRFRVQEPLFQRTVSLYEDVLDERGDTQHRPLGQATWVRTHGESNEGFHFALSRYPMSKKLLLETDNRDNPPIHLTSAKGYYTTSRLLFKAAPGKEIYLYYGNDDVAAPQYDLALIAGELLATPPFEASLGAEEVLKVKPWWEAPIPSGSMKYAFWAVMGLVVLGLLMVIAKLLPEEK